jgi:hypothetical protein
MHSRVLLVTALSISGAAHAQVNVFTGTPPLATNTLDFDAPFVPSGAISSTDPAFTNAGVASVAQFGISWVTGSDTITAGSNGSGQSLVVTGSGAGTLSVAGIGQPLSGSGTGGGFDVLLAAPASQFGLLFIDQINFNYTIELLLAGNSLGVGNFSYSGSFPQPPRYWTGPSAFDQIKVTFLSNVGVGVDDFAFDVVSTGPTTYCTAGTSTSGCTPTIGANAQPSVSLAHPCVIAATGVEGQKSGIIFYGIDNSGFSPTPWGVGGTSLLCVKSPTQRTLSQSSGGTSGACDGQLILDWNAYQSSNPSALGNPWMAGSKVFAQGWYRDPPAVKTTNLTDAVELTYVP